MMEVRRIISYGVGGWLEDAPQHNIVGVRDQWYDDEGNAVGDPVPVELPDEFVAPSSLDIGKANAPAVAAAPADVTS